MIKEKYVTPELEIIEFKSDDVIITSNEGPITRGMSYDPNAKMWSYDED